MVQPRRLSEEEERHNSVVAGVRGKIEAPYGWLKGRFLALQKPFYEDEEQHTCLVWYALACHRLMIMKK